MSKQHWDATKIPDQKGKVIIVTGSTSGIGKEAVKIIAGKNAKVIMAVRNVEKGKEVVNEIKKEFKNADIDVRKLSYGDSKLSYLYFTYELARRLNKEGDHPRIVR